MMASSTYEIVTHPDDDFIERNVFTTMRWDRRLLLSPQNTAASCNTAVPVYLFEHHWTRLQVAKWGTSWYSEAEIPAEARSPTRMLQVVTNAVNEYEKANGADSTAEALRVRLQCYIGGKMVVTASPMASLPFHRLFPTKMHHSSQSTASSDSESDFGLVFAITLDSRATETTETTMYKTYDRGMYDRARRDAGIDSLMAAQEVLLYSDSGMIFDGSIATPYFWREGKWTTPSSASGGQQGVTRRWAIENGLAVEGEIKIEDLVDGEEMWLSNAVKGFYRGVYKGSALD